MKLAIIGTGNVGSVLGTRWARSGHTVAFGSRHPESEKTQHVVAGAGPNASAASIADAVAGADVVVLATPWSGTQAALAAAGDLTGTIVVDCTNPLRPGRAGLAVGTDTSGGEHVAAWADGARVVKALNTTGSGNMAAPRYGDQAVTLFLCGDDAEAKQTVAKLAETLGFEVVDAGALTAARYLEPLAMLWIHLAYAQGHGPNIAFKLLRR
jgi:predicted dinucleotide-binding enzyme